ncbi:MAG: D-alanyl-D-alanine carboxypeptidase family protein [Christensenellales bacterium]|jgi:D-alanyl-D-alanine carboxypeptidase (penicillin-binding protein 5/6)
MKKLRAFGAVFLVVLAFASGSARAEKIAGVHSSASSLVEVESQRVLYSENGDKKLPMASTTKIMTALVAIEKGNLSDTVTITKEASGVEGSSIYLEVGETLTLEELLYGLMLHSGNDAAMAIAIHVGGSVSSFCEMMNQKARELGAHNTNFVNPHGLPASNHYTTANDLALIAAAAMRNEQFRNIVGTTSKTIPHDGRSWDRALNNKNKLLYSYNGANGIKTGYTKAAGRCLVGSACRDGMQLVSVVLNCSDIYNDTAAILDYGFANFARHTILAKNAVLGEVTVKNGIEEALEARAKDDIVLTLTEEEASRVQVVAKLLASVDAPVEEGDYLGTAEVWLDDAMIAATDLVATVSVREKSFLDYLNIVFGHWLL